MQCPGGDLFELNGHTLVINDQMQIINRLIKKLKFYSFITNVFIYLFVVYVDTGIHSC